MELPRSPVVRSLIVPGLAFGIMGVLLVFAELTGANVDFWVRIGYVLAIASLYREDDAWWMYLSVLLLSTVLLLGTMVALESVPLAEIWAFYLAGAFGVLLAAAAVGWLRQRRARRSPAD